jgi:hypothetical protein
MTRFLIVGVVLTLTAPAYAAPSPRRCAHVCAWAGEHCVSAFENAPRLKRCLKGVIRRCGGLPACFPTTTTTSAPTTTSSSSSSTSTTSTTTQTTTTSTTSVLISGTVHLRLVDDCLSAHSCSTGDGEPKVCTPPAPFYDAVVSVTATAPDGTYSVQLDLGDGPMTCPGGPHEVCVDDGEHTWCGQYPVATCSEWKHVLVTGVCSDTGPCTTYIVLRDGDLASDCNDVWVGTVVP